MNDIELRAAEEQFEEEHHDARKDKPEKAVRIYNDSPLLAPVDIYCMNCKKDYKRVAVKRHGIDRGKFRGVYYTVCPQDHKVLREITDKRRDPYIKNSVLLNKEWRQIKGDFKGQEGYEEKWGKMEREEKDLVQEKKLRDNFIKKYV